MPTTMPVFGLYVVSNFIGDDMRQPFKRPPRPPALTLLAPTFFSRQKSCSSKLPKRKPFAWLVLRGAHAHVQSCGLGVPLKGLLKSLFLLLAPPSVHLLPSFLPSSHKPLSLSSILFLFLVSL